ncbi:hypothetical protein BJ165DRAFT_1303133, partial [Panaeolus papilionaceus]
DSICKKYCLNKAQCKALRTVAQSLSISLKDKTATSLRMALMGAGGTGKSTVINAITDLFESVGHASRLRKCAYTGVASNNINGMTLHTALGIGRKNFSPNSHLHDQICGIWRGVDHLIIDEVSMIGCTTLFKISSALC